ncbi:hypothetical protein KJA15_03605 [Patescibacteria group bacterium]|nr:hypothetical protein [Patescibacteria group bacterium]
MLDHVTRPEIFNLNFNIARWVEKQTPITSIRDIVLGYVIGEAFARSDALVILTERKDPTEKDIVDILGMIKRRLPDIIKNIETELNR